jgi:excinuclease ABC subunit A
MSKSLPAELKGASIRIRGARQHNLKNLDLDIRTGEMTVVTGPSGSGKSSLVFDTLFAEGQRRYVETFSAYARQFLDRMDKPQVDRIEGVPPAIAIDQTNPVRTSRSTVGTMTELNDHLKLLFARTGELFDRDTALPVRHDSPQSIWAEMQARSAALGSDVRAVLTFAVQLPANTTSAELEQWLAASGFTRIHSEREAGGKKLLDVVADRFRLGGERGVEQARAFEAIELCLKRGGGRVTVHVTASEGAPEQVWRFSTGLHCPESDIRYAEPIPSMFSFNSAAGACTTCKGFGRVIGVDYGLVVPDVKKTLRNGAIKVFQTPAWAECQDDLMRHAEVAGIPRDTPWQALPQHQKDWVLHGTPDYKGVWSKQWYGVDRFFEYLESKAYKMHIRVLLSKYRSYTECPTCHGARLKADSLLWRVGSKATADAVMPPEKRFLPHDTKWQRAHLEALPGLCLHDLMLLPLSRLRRFFDALQDELDADVAAGPAAGPPQGGRAPSGGSEPRAAGSVGAAVQQATRMVLDEIRNRVRYLCDVGLGYLTLDRQSRTLSGGEVQRINLTTALGTSLVNTLFVLDEPSIGLHPRDMAHIVEAMHRLRDAGNTLVVVEHDPAVMLAADRLIDMGPGPGARGGQIVFDGPPDAIRHADTLTGAYLGARKSIGLGLRRAVDASTPRLIVQNARDHNLQGITVEFPLNRLVTVTGVSGSGKSTLMQDVLYPALCRAFGKATETPGAHDALLGADWLSDATFVDQSPIGKTARSNPASYVGAWDAIRALFATTPLAAQRSYTAAKFSFNSGDGRCPTCGGSGFEHVEMQFLSDVYLRCPDCDGKRYRPEVLEVHIERGGRSLNVADVLELTVEEAAAAFASDREVQRVLRPLVEVGLEYVKLGQPVPTLSGGESQRLKLAGYLAEAASVPLAQRWQPPGQEGHAVSV